MKEYLAKKYAFAVVFIVILYGVAIVNIMSIFEELKKDVKETVTQSDIKDMDSFFEISNGLVQTLDATITGNVNERYSYLELYGLYSKVLGKNEFNGFKIVKDNNGFLFYGNLWNFKKNEDIRTDILAKRVYRMNEKLKEKGSKLYVLSIPVKSMSEYLEFDQGIPYQDFTSVADDYIYYCDILNIEVVNVDRALKKSDLNYEEMFFKTDHHWTPMAAFYAYKYLVDELRKDGYELDPDNKFTDISNYNIESYEKCWLGTFGINTGANYINELESLTILVPKFETSFKYEYRYSGDKHVIDKEGSFEETLLDRKYIHEQANNNLYSGSAYSTYLNGICTYDHIENKNNPNGPKVLFIRDSYSSPLGAFFANVCSEVDMIWAKDYEENIEELVENNDYDFVFLATWPENIADDSFNFYVED